MNTFLEELAEVTDMHTFVGPIIKTPDSYDPETFDRLGGRPPEDINAYVMWDDSGAELYVFPSRDNWCTVAIHTCKTFDRDTALHYVYKKLHLREDMQFSEQTDQASSPWEQFAFSNGKAITPEKHYLPTLAALLETDTSDTEAVIAAGFALENIVATAGIEGWGSRLAACFKPPFKEKIWDIHSAFEIAIDARFMDDVLAGNVADADAYYFQRPMYNHLSRMEAEIADMQKEKRVMHIGTGWPGTAIGLYEQFGIPVTCVEKDSAVAEKSRKALDKLGLLGQDKLQVICADGCDINPTGFGAVIVSAMVPSEDKLVIMHNMRDLALGEPDEPILILRTPSTDVHELFYQPLSAEIRKQAEIFTRVGDNEAEIGKGDPLRSMAFRIPEKTTVRRPSLDQLKYYDAAVTRLKPPVAMYF